MRTASRQRSPGRLLAFLSGLAALIFARACFIEIEEPVEAVPPDAGVGGSVSAGGTAGNGGALGTVGNEAGGSAGTAGGNDSGGDVTCNAPSEICGGLCVNPTDPTHGCGQCRAPCPTPNNRAATCVSGQCMLAGCQPGYVDCDNNLETNGCEVRFGPAPSELQSAQWDGGTSPDGGSTGPRPAYKVPRLTGALDIDGDSRDWPPSASLIRLLTPCTGCQANPSNQPGGFPGVPVLFPDEVPPATDLEAYFRIGWAPGALYVLALVKDNEALSTPPSSVPNAPAGTSPAATQDGVELFLDGSAEFNDGYDDDDRHLFIGAFSGLWERPDGRADPAPLVQIGRRTEGACYFVELKLNSTYLASTANAAPPDVGVIYGFDIGINDWDTETGVPKRAHQVLWKNPGVKYYFDTVAFPAVELTP